MGIERDESLAVSSFLVDNKMTRKWHSFLLLRPVVAWRGGFECKMHGVFTKNTLVFVMEGHTSWSPNNDQYMGQVNVVVYIPNNWHDSANETGLHIQGDLFNSSQIPSLSVDVCVKSEHGIVSNPLTGLRGVCVCVRVCVCVLGGVCGEW